MCCLAVGRAPEKTRFFISHKPHYENSSTNIVTGQEKERNSEIVVYFLNHREILQILRIFRTIFMV
jgi:hypothetical protein